jgi:hypothetical protein
MLSGYALSLTLNDTPHPHVLITFDAHRWLNTTDLVLY